MTNDAFTTHHLDILRVLDLCARNRDENQVSIYIAHHKSQYYKYVFLISLA